MKKMYNQMKTLVILSDTRNATSSCLKAKISWLSYYIDRRIISIDFMYKVRGRKMSFGENLRKLRKERGLSQEQLAEKINVSRQAVSKWEQGGGYPETEKIILIAKNLNVSLDYLLVGIESEEKSEMQKEKNVVPTGKISIRTFDGKTVVTCHKVSVSNVLLAGKDEPKYVLNGVDKVSFWGENTTTLGWYTNEEDIKKEIVDITKAINGGLQAYDLKYAAKVKIGIIGVKLE